MFSFSVYHGDSYKWQFVLWQDPGKTIPADLTGVVPKAEIRSATGGGTLITTMDLTVQTPNTIMAALPAIKTTLLPKAGGVWDLQLTYPNSDVQTVLQGTVTVTMDVTDSVAAAGLSGAAQGAIRPVIPGRRV